MFNPNKLKSIVDCKNALQSNEELIAKKREEIKALQKDNRDIRRHEKKIVNDLRYQNMYEAILSKAELFAKGDLSQDNFIEVVNDSLAEKEALAETNSSKTTVKTETPNSDISPQTELKSDSTVSVVEQKPVSTDASHNERLERIEAAAKVMNSQTQSTGINPADDPSLIPAKKKSGPKKKSASNDRYGILEYYKHTALDENPDYTVYDIYEWLIPLSSSDVTGMDVSIAYKDIRAKKLHEVLDTFFEFVDKKVNPSAMILGLGYVTIRQGAIRGFINTLALPSAIRTHQIV